jgi:hypothetical protein
MTDREVYADGGRPLTPRQDRIEATIERVLRMGGTRSELREAVHQFADHARLLGMPPEGAVAAVKAVALRASTTMGNGTIQAVGDAPADRIALIVRWCEARYYRAD